MPLPRGRGGKIGERHLQGDFIENRAGAGHRLVDVGVGLMQFAVTAAPRIEGHVDVQSRPFLTASDDVGAADRSHAAHRVDLGQEIRLGGVATELSGGDLFPGDGDLGPLRGGDFETLHERE